MKHVYFSRCLKGAVLEWYCHDLEYRVKVYWDLLSTAFDACWKPTTGNMHVVEVVHVVEVLQDLKLRNFMDIHQQYINYHTARQYCVAADTPELPMQTTTTAIPEHTDTAIAAVFETTTASTTAINTEFPRPPKEIKKLWQKNARKATKMAYQNNVAKNGYPLTANQTVIDRATKTAILTNMSVE